MRVRFWGTRGSIPTPGPRTASFGGNTSCVEVRPSDGSLLIFDCGTGIRDLGMNLMRSRSSVTRMSLLIGHTHWDHIQGFPFFPLIFNSDVELNIYAPIGFQRSLEEAIAGQMQYSYFPVKLQDLSSRIYYTELGEGFFRIGEVLVETRYLNHTAPTIAYRLTDGPTTVAYVTDHEPYWSAPGPVFLHPGDRQHVEFLKDCDLIIHDAQYTAEEYQTKRSWGHSPIEYATDVAVAAKASRLALFHHDPAHDDDKLREIESMARERAASYGSGIEVFCAAEGYELNFTGRGAVVAGTKGVSALDPDSDAGGRVLLLFDNPAELADIKTSLLEESCIITATSDVRSAEAIVAHSCPDIVIMGMGIRGGVANSTAALRNASGNPELPVLLIAEGRETNESSIILEDVATDYIARPLSAPMLRSRVRAWRFRNRAAGDVHASSREESRKQGAPASSPPQFATDNFLATSSMFATMTHSELVQLVGSGSEQVYPAGTEIIHQGGHSDGTYVVLSGRVRVVEEMSERGMDLVLGEFGAGEVFGELGVLQDYPRSATVMAVEETRCLRIPGTDFLTALENSTQLSLALCHTLGDRLDKTDELLARHAPDALTRLPSRLAFRELYSRLAGSARRRKASVLLLAIDVLQIKRINDEYGYASGDAALKTVADALLACFGEHGLIARYGGDEFAVLIPDLDGDRADELIGDFRGQLHQLAVHRALPFSVNCSVGFASSQKPPDSVDELLREADQDMETKRRAKNYLAARGT
jgi:diguanylate cyclase (GGDEF)-like protein